MSTLPCLGHVSLGTNQMEKAAAFYDAVMHALGCKRVIDFFPNAIAYGRENPEFWITAPLDGKPATVGNGTHIAFLAASHQQVRDFHHAALQAGGQDDGEPGPRPDYGPQYYGAFVRDLEGHKLEAVFFDPDKNQTA